MTDHHEMIRSNKCGDRKTVLTEGRYVTRLGGFSLFVWTVLLATAFHCPGLVFAQPDSLPDDVLQTDSFENDFAQRIDVDEDLIRKFNTAQRLVEEDRVLEAATAIQSLLEYEADFLLQPHQPRVSSREYLRGWVEQLPASVLQAYETQAGPQARFLLETYKKSRQLEQLQQASRVYLHTASGAEATFVLATHFLDRGEFLAALSQLNRLAVSERLSRQFEPAVTIQRAVCLARLGQLRQAQQLVRTRFADSDQPVLTLGNETYDLPKLIEQLQMESSTTATTRRSRFSENVGQWQMFRKSANRQRTAVQFSPLPRPAWSTDLVEALIPAELPRRERVTNLIDYLFRLLEENEFTALPAWNPIVVGDRLFVAGFGAVAGFSADDGRLLWRSATNDQVLGYLQNEELSERYDVYDSGEIRELHMYLLQQLVGNLTEGNLSSDGERIFAIRGGGLVTAPVRNQLFQSRETIPLLPTETNLLTAFAAASGKILWEIGGVQGGQVPEFAGHFFLGPPIPVDDRLYIVSENGAELFVSEISPHDGRPEWMQPLIEAEFPIDMDRSRRICGTEIAYEAPYLICQLNSGIVVTFDLLQREFCWQLSYLKPIDEQGQRANRRGLFRNGFDRFPTSSRRSPRSVDFLNGKYWQETTPVVVGNHVLLTPGDAQELFCCNLLTGQLLWEVPREEGLLNGLYVEAGTSGDVLVIGPRAIRCLNLADGSVKWTTPLAQAVPAGRGLVQDRVYHLPTLNQGLLSFELETGHLIAWTEPEPEMDVPLGNLVATRGQMFSLGSGTLTGFQTLTELEARLVDTGEPDFEQLKIRGQLALHAGKITEGIAALQQAYRLQREPELARQLTATLLNADAAQIELTEQQIVELAEMMLQADHSIGILFRYVAALERLKKPIEALQVLSQLLADERHRHQIVAISGDLRVRADYLAAGFVSDLYATSAPDVQAEMLSFLGAQIAETSEPLMLSRRMPIYALPQLQRAARLKFVRINSVTENPLLQERHLRWLLTQTELDNQPELTARLAELYFKFQKWSCLRPLIAELNGPYADQLCLKSKTGAQLAQLWDKPSDMDSPGRSPQAAQTSVADRYRVTIASEVVPGNPSQQPRPINATLPADSPWQNWRFDLLQADAQLRASGPSGQQQWTLQFADELSGSADAWLQQDGQLALLSRAGDLLAIDTFGEVDPAQQQPNQTATLSALWQEQFEPSGDSAEAGFGITAATVNPIIGITPLMRNWQQEIGQIGRSVDHRLVYRQQGRVVVRDSRLGTLIWEAETVETETVEDVVVWADQNLVYQLDLVDRQGRCHRLADGKVVNNYVLPKHDRLVSLTEQMALFWKRSTPQRGELIALDLTDGTIAWTVPTSGSLTWAAAQTPYIIFFDAARSLIQIINPLAATPVVSEFAAPETTARELLVKTDETSWYLHITEKPDTITQPLAFYSLEDTHGPLIAIDRDTLKPRWTIQLEQLRWIPRQPASWPFLMYGSVIPLGRAAPNDTQQMIDDLRLQLVDKQTGQTITEFQEGLAGRLVDFEADQPAGTYQLHFSNGTMTVETLPRPTQTPEPDTAR